MSDPGSVARLVRRADFLAANSGGRVATPAFILLARRRGDASDAMRVGFTVSKKVGNAVVRNRAKRRLRALTRDLLPAHGLPGTDHVLIGRAQTRERDFATMADDLRRALARLGA